MPPRDGAGAAWRWGSDCAVAGLALWSPGSPERWLIPALAALAVATFLGAPIFTALGGAALILFWGHGEPIQSVPLKHYSLTTNDLLPSIPIFTLAGYFLAESGASKRLVRVFQALVGQLRGGPAIVTALVCAFFTSFTGASRSHYPGPGRGADARAYRRPLLGAQRPGPAHRRRFPGHALPALPAVDPLCRRGQPERPRQSDHQTDVPRRHRAGHPSRPADLLVGHSPGQGRGRSPRLSLARGPGGPLGCQVGIAHPGRCPGLPLHASQRRWKPPRSPPLTPCS